MRTLFFLILLIQAFSIYNPGVLISIPFPLSPPPLDLDLPLPISDLLISGLELSNIELRQVDYAWRFVPQYAEVNVSRALLSFDWNYKKDSGKGFFVEDELRLELDWNFTVTKSNRFFIDILQTKIQPGKSKVELGGGVKETVAVEITNLILNRASIVFRSFIGIIGSKQHRRYHRQSPRLLISLEMIWRYGKMEHRELVSILPQQYRH